MNVLEWSNRSTDLSQMATNLTLKFKQWAKMSTVIWEKGVSVKVISYALFL